MPARLHGPGPCHRAGGGRLPRESRVRGPAGAPRPGPVGRAARPRPPDPHPGPTRPGGMPGAVKKQGSGWTRVASVSSYEVGTVCPERHFTQRGRSDARQGCDVRDAKSETGPSGRAQFHRSLLTDPLPTRSEVPARASATPAGRFGGHTWGGRGWKGTTAPRLTAAGSFPFRARRSRARRWAALAPNENGPPSGGPR